MKTILSLVMTCMLVVIFQSCEDDVSFELTAYTKQDYKMMSEYLDIAPFPPDYDFEIPSSFSATQINDSQAELGRVLFYDKNLSKDRTISCESCHKQHLAFADDVAFSTGVAERKTSRNSQGLGSVLSFSAYYGSASLNQIPFFWDNRASSVQEQSEKTLNNPQEMDMKMHEVVSRVKEQPYYAPLFRSAYLDEKVTEQRVLDAISEFINSMATFDSPFDRAIVGVSAANLNNFFYSFSVSENLGKQLFLDNCATCHNRRLGRPNKTAANNGLDVVYEDKGIGALTNQEADMGMFKVPTLRNLELTAPYMHDGRFETLEEVIEHYSTGIKAHQNLSEELQQDWSPEVEPRQFNFTSEEKVALVDFLKTLTDMSFVNNPKYANPFR